MVPVERPKTNEKFASREKILKWKTGFRKFISFARSNVKWRTPGEEKIYATGNKWEMNSI
jgi:hypothetical protein